MIQLHRTMEIVYRDIDTYISVNSIFVILITCSLFKETRRTPAFHNVRATLYSVINHKSEDIQSLRLTDL